MKENEELWKPVAGYPGYEDYYQISSCGRVYSVRSGRCLTPKKYGGYLYVTLSVGGKTKACRIHRLVALAFIPNPKNKPTVNHINEIKTDNNVDNLEWATVKEQNNHGTRTARAMAHTDWEARTKKMDYSVIASKHNYHEINRRQMKPVLRYDKDGNFIARYDGVSVAAKAAGRSAGYVCECLKGDRNDSKNIWKYA